MSLLRLVSRRAATDVVALLSLLVLVGVTAALAAAAPRVHNQTADEALGKVVGAAPPAARELTISSTNDYGLEQLGIIDEQVRDSLDEPLAGLVTAPVFAATTPLYDSYAWPSGELFHPRPYAWLKLRHQAGLLDQVRWVRGRAPRGSGTASVDGAGSGATVPRLEVALDADVADQLEIALGDEVLLRPLEGQLGRGGPVLVVVSGLFTPADPDDLAWDFDPLLRTPGLEVSGSGELVARYASALVADGRAVKSAAANLAVEWHYPLRTEDLDAANAEAVLADLERFATQGFSVESSRRMMLGSVPGYVPDSGLQDLLADYLRQAGSAEAVVAMALAGLLLVALLVVGFAARLLGRQRATATRLLRARGASWAQLLALQAAETLCVVLPAGLLGHALAVGAVSSRASALSTALVGCLVLVTVAWSTVAYRQEARQQPGEMAATTSGWGWRAMLEAGLVVAAVGGVLLVRRRGVGTPADAGADPLLAVVPLLVALAAGLLALRAQRWLTGAVMHVVGRRRGAVGFVALASAGRRSGVTSVVVLVLLTGLAFALFASSVTTTIKQGQSEAAYLAVGADYRLDGPGFSEEQLVDAEEAPGVSAVAPALLRPDVPVSGDAARADVAAFAAVDAETYPAISAAASGGDRPDLAGLAGGGDTLPVLVTPGVLAAAETGQSRSPLSLSLGSGIGDVDAEVVGTLEDFPIAGDAESVVADLSALQELEGGALRPTTLLVRGEPAAAPVLADLTERWDAGVELVDRRSLLEATRGLPFVDSTVAVFRAGSVAVAAYGLAAVVLFLLLTSATRARLDRALRSLGMAPRQRRAVAALELVPLVGLAVVVGCGVGAWLAHLLIPAVELVSFTGGSSPPDPVVGAGAVALLVLTAVALVAVATLGVSTLTGRRRGEEIARTEADE